MKRHAAPSPQWRRPLLGLFALTLMPGASQAAPKPIPPIVQKYVRAIGGARTLSVDVTQAGTRRTLHLVLARPNRVRLTSSNGDRHTSAFVCDGGRVYEWDEHQYTRSDAPATLAEATPALPSLRDDVAVGMTVEVMLKPHGVEAQDVALRRAGLASLHGVRCDRIEVRPTSGHRGTIFFAQATGLPVRIVLRAFGRTTTLTFRHFRIDRSVADDAFSARPPTGLTPYAISGEAPSPTGSGPAPAAPIPVR